MRQSALTFQQYILPAIITGICGIVVCLITLLCTGEKEKLASREITETRHSNGTVIKRAMEIFK